MNAPRVLDKIETLLRDLLDRSDVILTGASTAADVEGWDSLTHIQLIAAIEKAFTIKFTALEIYNFKNVGDICEAVIRR